MRYLLTLSLLLLAAPALADTAVAEPVAQSPLYTLFLQYIAVPLCSGIGILVMALLGYLTAKVKASAEKDKAAGKAISASDIAARVLHISTVIVQDIQVTLRPELEDALADGKLTEVEKAKLKAAALARIKATLGKTGMAELRDLLGIAEDGLGGYLSGLIESALVGVKSAAPVPPPSLASVSVSLPSTAAARP